jgi:hypothetical protein
MKFNNPGSSRAARVETGALAARTRGVAALVISFCLGNKALNLFVSENKFIYFVRLRNFAAQRFSRFTLDW